MRQIRGSVVIGDWRIVLARARKRNQVNDGTAPRLHLRFAVYSLDHVYQYQKHFVALTFERTHPCAVFAPIFAGLTTWHRQPSFPP